MYTCKDCSFSGLLDQYCKHIKIWHLKKEYVCGQNNCIRTFSAIQYLKRHLKAIHNHQGATEAVPSDMQIHQELQRVSVYEKSTCSQIETHDDNNFPRSTERGTTNSYSTIEAIDEDYMQFILSLYSHSSLDRKKATKMAASTSKIVVNILNFINSKIELLPNNLEKDELQKTICDIEDIFSKTLTEKSLLKNLRQRECYKDPISITIDETVADTTQHRQLVLHNKKSTAVKIDISFLFKSFFELPGIYNTCTEYMKVLESNTEAMISNVIQGSSWNERKKHFGSKIVIPYCLYHDDFEPGNTLGANSGVQALSSFFVHFPTLPPHIATSLENIFPIFCCKTNQKKYGFDKILHSSIVDFCKLEEEGLVLNIDGENIQVYFALCVLLGDNKALNELMGLTFCFVKDGYCRNCTCTVEETKYLAVEDTSKLRTNENYAQQLAINDFRSTGIREECVLNKIPTFNALDCISADIMHDIFEGVCHFQMTKIILHFLEATFFTLDDLSNRISLFDFGFYEVDNLPVDIQISHLKNGKLKMSASQSICFTIHFGLIIGDLVPRGNNVWALYSTFVQLVNLLLQNSFTLNEIESIKKLTQKNHTQYIDLFKIHLKPKQHFMIHYAELIKKLGPLKKLYVMKQEMYHRELKRYINQSYNRQNLPLSVLIKESLKFASRLVDRRGNTDYFFAKENINKNMNVRNIKFSNVMQSLINITPDIYENITFLNEIHFKNILFKSESIVFIKKNEDFECHKVIYIFKLSETVIKMFSNQLEVIRFDEHFQCNIIKDSNLFRISDFSELHFFPQCMHKLPTGEFAILNPIKF